MEKGSRVSYSWREGIHANLGTGEVISDPDAKGRVLLACDPQPFLDDRVIVILCNLNRLVEIV